MRKLWRDSLSQVPKDPEVCCFIVVLCLMDLHTSGGGGVIAVVANGKPTAGNACYDV